MSDLIFIAATVVFFLIAVGYVRACEKLQEESLMSLGTLIIVVVSALLLFYLAYALLRAEKF